VADGNNSWNCSSCLTFRGLPAEAAAWSVDGSLLATAFSHIVSLWDQDSRLRTTLAKPGDDDPIICLQFGRASSSRFLITVSQSSLTTWDLLTLSTTWHLPLVSSPHLHLAPCPTTNHIALVQKDVIMILDPSRKTVVESLRDVNCTGAAVFSKTNPSYLYFINYCGVVKRVGPKLDTSKANTRVYKSRSALRTLLESKGKVVGKKEEYEKWTTSGGNDDIEALLSLPVHTLPAPSSLQNCLLKNRVLGLPKLVLSTGEEDKSEQRGQLEKNRQQKKFQQVFNFKLEGKEDAESDLKAFSKKLRKQATL